MFRPVRRRVNLATAPVVDLSLVQEPFYQRDGDRFLSTESTRGPWDPGLQHGGPPSALLCRAFEELADPMQLVRLTVEMIRPIPIAPLLASTEIVRAGRKATWLAGTLRCNDRLVARATGTAIRTTELQLPQHVRPHATMAGLDTSPPYTFTFFQEPVGYHTAMEMRIERGTWGEGPVAAWMRMRVPLVAGETPSPFQRVVVAADAGNGVSITLPIDRFTVINPDLTVYLHRLPQGEWIGMDAITVPEARGVGVTESRLHDAEGPVGRALQALVVEARDAAPR